MPKGLFANIPESLSAPMLGEGPRRKILEATARVAAEHGCQGFTVQDILNEANVARRTFYRAFSNREEALLALFELGTAAFLYVIEMAAQNGPTAETRLIRAVETYLDLQRTGGRLIMVLQEEALRADSLLAPRRQEVLGRLMALLSDAHHEVSGERVDPLVFRTLLLGMEGLIIHLQRDGRFTQAHRDKVRDVFVPILVRTLAPPGVATPELALVAEACS